MNSSNNTLARRENGNIEERVTTTSVQPAPMWVDGNVQRTNTLASYLEVPFMHKRLIIACTLIGMLLGWAAIIVWPRRYESEAKLAIRVGRESVSLDPTATTSATLMLQKTQEEEVISALEVLSSRQVASDVVDKLGAEVVLDGHLPSAGTAETSRFEEMISSVTSSVGDAVYAVLKNAGIKEDISNRELAIRRLRESAGIYSPKKSNVVIVEATSKSPLAAQAIVTEMTSAFLDIHLEGAHTSGSYEFFEQQSAEVEAELNDLVAQRSKFMQEHNIVSIDSNRALLEQELNGINRDFVLASGQLEQALSEIEDLKDKLDTTEDEIVAAKTEASDITWSGMRQRVYDLELDEKRLAASVTDDHPQLLQVRDQLGGARKILAALESERVNKSTTPNPLKMKLREDLQKQNTQIVGLRSIIKEKQAKKAELQQKTNDLLEQERQLTAMDRNIRLVENSLGLLQEKMEEARVIDELHSNKISNVNVFQPATLTERPTSPRKKLLAAGFSLLGLTTGLGLAFVRYASAPSLRTKEDVEFELGMPVLSSIPRMQRMASLRLREQKLYREKCQGILAEVMLSRGGAQSHEQGRSIGVIGVDNGAGASTLAANLALSSSVDCPLRTILVDADVRQRAVSKMFGLNGLPGLVELMGGIASHDECLQKARNAPLDLVSSAADSSDKLLTSSALEIIQALSPYKRQCDLMIVDLPAASQPDQAIALAQHLDCVIVVVESEKTDTTSAERIVRRLTSGNTEVIGIVLNKTRNYLPAMLRKIVAPRA